MLDRLSGKLGDLIRQIGGKAHISEKNIQDAINEIKIALLEADVNLRVVRRFVNQATEEALGEKVLRSVTPGQQFIKILYDRMVALLGGESQGLTLKGPDTQTVILLAGLQGSGKTTTAAKLALRLKEQGGFPSWWRQTSCGPPPWSSSWCSASMPASRCIARRRRIRCSVVEGALARARREQFDVVIVDTSGRLQADDALMAELLRIRDAAKPDEMLLVADAMTGQNAVDIAKEFDAKVALTGRHPHEVRLRYPRRRRPLGEEHHREADQVRRRRGEAGRPGAVPSRAGSPRGSSAWATW